MSLLEHIYYINLEHRTERREYIEKEISRLCKTIPVRIDAVKKQYGVIGCAKSHIKALEIAKANDLPYVCIMEDDLMFMDKFGIKKRIDEFVELGLEWDVLLLGGNCKHPFYYINPNVIKVENSLSTMCYIVKKHYYDILLDNFKSGLKLYEDTMNDMFIIDMYWMSLQKQDNWYMILPLSVTQLVDFSDIQGINVTYNHLLLNLH